MIINGKVHCFFEQSGTFKNEFIKLGIPAEDYDIQHSKIHKKCSGHNAIVYTLTNFDTTFEQDLERIYTLRDMGYWAYVMIYDKEHCEEKYRRLQRWVNNRIIFAVCKKFEDFKG